MQIEIMFLVEWKGTKRLFSDVDDIKHAVDEMATELSSGKELDYIISDRGVANFIIESLPLIGEGQIAYIPMNEYNAMTDHFDIETEAVQITRLMVR